MFRSLLFAYCLAKWTLFPGEALLEFPPNQFAIQHAAQASIRTARKALPKLSAIRLAIAEAALQLDEQNRQARWQPEAIEPRVQELLDSSGLLNELDQIMRDRAEGCRHEKNNK
jgi:hypothetical protein